MLNALSCHERSLFVETYDGEQCSGFWPRKWLSQGHCFELRIPRTRSGAFRPMILGILKEQEEERAALFHELYVRGLTCKDIGEICERINGRQYSNTMSCPKKCVCSKVWIFAASYRPTQLIVPRCRLIISSMYLQLHRKSFCQNIRCVL